MSQFIVEARAGQFEYARVLADFTSNEENALQLSAGDIVAVVPKVLNCYLSPSSIQIQYLTQNCAQDDEYTQRGWLYGIKDGQYGLFPSDFVDPLSPRSIRKEIKTISRITQQPSSSSQRHHRDNRDLSGDSPVDDIDDEDVEDDDRYSGAEGDTWGRRGPGHTSYDAGDTSDVSISALKVNIDQSEASI